VFNADVAFAAVLKAAARRAGARIATFGSATGCDARLVDFQPHETGARVRAELFGKKVDFQLAQSGFHWGLNSLCVLLMLEALDVPLDTALAALSEFQPLEGRGQVRVVHAPGGDFTLIDESYNANPLSMEAGFRSLGARPLPATGGRRVVVLTDMLELGDQSEALHEGLSGPIDAAGIDLVHAAGPEMKRLYDDLPGSRQGLWRETAAELAGEAAMLVGRGDIVMVKGSNGSRASLIAKALAALGGAG
jgi:UDP-N-acetylmuramoyl-tripeptide--D-alanyl-D-alanine ligase